MKKQLIVTGFIIVLIVLLSLPRVANSSLLRISEYSDRFEGKKVEEIYEEERKKSKEELIGEILTIESEIRSSEDEIWLVPSIYALMEKEDEFTEEELCELLKKEESGHILDEALARIIRKKQPRREMLLDLIFNKRISAGAKGMLISCESLKTKDLVDIMEGGAEEITTMAMKVLCVRNADEAFKWAAQILTFQKAMVSDEQKTCACLGFSAYYDQQEVHKKEALKEEYLPVLREISREKKGTILGDNAVYSMIQMRDYEVIRELLFDEQLDFDLKVSAIDTCYSVLIEEIEKNTSFDRIDAVIKALEIHPVRNVAEALEKAIEDERYPEDEEIMQLIKNAIQDGVWGVDKHEK
ncbi:MAG: hypothetical protein IK138_00025 [Lachnospiraceae bacterium]|nr:hypothetical protein [Lachnospiraceae bacterium]